MWDRPNRAAQGCGNAPARKSSFLEACGKLFLGGEKKKTENFKLRIGNQMYYFDGWVSHVL